jgi:hypothetical protein
MAASQRRRSGGGRSPVPHIRDARDRNDRQWSAWSLWLGQLWGFARVGARGKGSAMGRSRWGKRGRPTETGARNACLLSRDQFTRTMRGGSPGIARSGTGTRHATGCRMQYCIQAEARLLEAAHGLMAAPHSLKKPGTGRARAVGRHGHRSGKKLTSDFRRISQQRNAALECGYDRGGTPQSW